MSNNQFILLFGCRLHSFANFRVAVPRRFVASILYKSSEAKSISSYPYGCLNTNKNNESILRRQINRRLDINDQLKAYFQLSKCRLTMLITATAVGGFLLPPAVLSVEKLAACIVGTSLLSASACSFNNILEVPYDRKMKRTKSRVMASSLISDTHAFAFAGLTAFTGLGVLCVGCNPLTSALGALNLGIYAFIYTPLKRRHVSCTWFGAIVGAIPPIMGYTAATNTIDPTGLLLAGILFCWQFPHFNALSWNLKKDYEQAGYKIMSVCNEGLCRRSTLRHAFGLLALCSMAPFFNLCDQYFAIGSLPLNFGILYLSYKFYLKPDSEISKRLFRYTLAYLPLLMLLLVLTKRPSNSDDDNKKAPNSNPMLNFVAQNFNFNWFYNN